MQADDGAQTNTTVLGREKYVEGLFHDSANSIRHSEMDTPLN
jgi:hypothetical protein